MQKPLYRYPPTDMPAYTASLLSIHGAYCAWLLRTRQPWTWKAYAISEALRTAAYQYAIAWHAVKEDDPCASN